jgi:hypothetical protein
VEIKLLGLFEELPKIKGNTAFDSLLNALLFANNLMFGYQGQGWLIEAIEGEERWEVDFPKVELVWRR